MRSTRPHSFRDADLAPPRSVLRTSQAACARFGHCALVTAQVPGFDSPEAAALATWQSRPSAHARVVSVDIRGDRAEVVIDTDPSYPDWVYCVRRGGRWVDVRSGNGPSYGWDDPDILNWD
jgi:hypothetical protein